MVEREKRVCCPEEVVELSINVPAVTYGPELLYSDSTCVVTHYRLRRYKVVSHRCELTYTWNL